MLIDIKPNTVKRNREKKFTKYRNPYKAYNNAKWNWSNVFNRINTLKENGTHHKCIKNIANEYGINYNTLKCKYTQWCKNKDNTIDIEKRGGYNKTFTETEEKELFIHIKKEYIDKHLPLCNEDIKTMAKEKFKLNNQNNEFKASTGWCCNFKKKWNLISVTPKISRISTHICTKDEIHQFIELCTDSLKDVGNDFFF